MSQEPKDPNQEKGTSQAGRSGRKEVELFPALGSGRKFAAAPVATGGVMRQAAHIGTQISIFTPVSYDEALDIVECLRSRAATTITLDKMRKVDASRLVDFVSGASAALDGDFHKLTEQVYVFCPANIKIVAPTVAAKQQGAFDFLFNEAADKSSIWGTKGQ
jgi:FtsZ-interacting cell division protein YlmF